MKQAAAEQCALGTGSVLVWRAEGLSNWPKALGLAVDPNSSILSYSSSPAPSSSPADLFLPLYSQL